MESLIEFRKVVFSFNGDVMVIAHWFAAYDFDVAVDKFDFAPVQSPDMRSARCKKILVHGDEPHKLSVTFLFWLRINLLLTIHDVAVDKLDFSPVQSPDM